VSLSSRKKRRWLIALLIIPIAGVALFWQFRAEKTESQGTTNDPRVEGVETQSWWEPGRISMYKMKRQGCVADGLLSGYGDDTDESVAMIKRSNCIYLHRALETWGDNPDFEKAFKIMQKINKSGLIYGMFISEAIKKGTDADYQGDGKKFDFSAMCRKGSENTWGFRTCKADTESAEYRRYLQFITHRAMDIGIQSFMFGQVYYQDGQTLEQSAMPDIIADMKSYANERGMQIVIGAQTGNITEERYLRLFDYIEGGVGIGPNGNIEDGPCWSRKSTCWALLWNDRYAKKAYNVFLHLDWSGLAFDDMSSFAKMNKQKRTDTLKRLHGYFTSRDMGFLMPMMATINRDIGGCRGPKKRFYSASNAYTCQDESTINSIMGKAK
jgi:hypothetical protein